MTSYNVQATVFYLTAFTFILPLQLTFGLQHKTYGVLVAAFLGICLEILAYTARILVYHGTQQLSTYFISITAAPTFFSAVICLCLARIVNVFGASLSPVTPKTYRLNFVLFHLFAIILQVVGGGIAGMKKSSFKDAGTKIMQVGLAIHLIIMAIIIVTATAFFRNVYRQTAVRNSPFDHLHNPRTFKAFLVALTMSTMTIIIRTCFRIAEPTSGVDGKDETAFFVFEGAMTLFACSILSALHPGIAFRGNWKASGQGETSPKIAKAKEFEDVKSVNHEDCWNMMIRT